MRDVIRFICPDTANSEAERKHQFMQRVEQWVRSDALAEMVSVFGKSVPKRADLKSTISWLNTFADEWDYRKKQANGGERWNVAEDNQAFNNRDTIMRCVRTLGLVDIEDPVESPDYILPLGGARRSNYVRPLLARKKTDEFGVSNAEIVALSGNRPISEVEKPFLEDYAPEAETEYEAIIKGMENVFGLSEKEYDEEMYQNDNQNLSWSVRTFRETYKGNRLYAVAAPSSDPERRANSRDTFNFFLDKYRIQPGASLLLVTSCIYVPFQLLKFMDLAIERGFYVDCIGVPNSDKEGTAFSQMSNYCQETKAAINAIYSLSQKWL